MMSNEQFDTFITALRSGEYKQGRSQLMVPPEHQWHAEGEEPDGRDAYCCLGLYCEINGVDLRKSVRVKESLGNGRYRTSQFLRFELGGIEHGPRILLNDIPYKQRVHLAKMNDSSKTFAEIADYLVAHRDEFVRKEAA